MQYILEEASQITTTKMSVYINGAKSGGSHITDKWRNTDCGVRWSHATCCSRETIIISSPSRKCAQ